MDGDLNLFPPQEAIMLVMRLAQLQAPLKNIAQPSFATRLYPLSIYASA